MHTDGERELSAIISGASKERQGLGTHLPRRAMMIEGCLEGEWSPRVGRVVLVVRGAGHNATLAFIVLVRVEWKRTRIFYFLNGKTNLNHHPSITSRRELPLNPFEETVLLIKACKLRISALLFLRVFFCFRRPEDNCYRYS